MKSYLMESEEEARRLVAQAQAHPVLPHLVATGLSEGQHALDAGCGPGVITRHEPDSTSLFVVRPGVIRGQFDRRN